MKHIAALFGFRCGDVCLLLLSFSLLSAGPRLYYRLWFYVKRRDLAFIAASNWQDRQRLKSERYRGGTLTSMMTVASEATGDRGHSNLSRKRSVDWSWIFKVMSGVSGESQAQKRVSCRWQRSWSDFMMWRKSGRQNEQN